ncbi:NAD+ synthase [Chelatococcus daeguensis]|uniref:Glutamine-dependent NAD(+) synthetase n=1 Tax=Chelatococcus sambhunathii TaxID=363953 RepID=A0ABM9U3U5_9HYPH|nr:MULTISPECIES: NAD+ synthase [Chelatococcus]KZE35639.1 NAD synthetase [Chelatococcus daeguensis]MBM3084918.1 NAD+ synthase [Chelatococcus daeguensis]CUA87817.1 NAD+ synthetase [Chelatococcus sambhunathii]
MTTPIDRFRLALAQLNPIMGDIAANLAMARKARAEAAAMGADVVMFTELFLAGYPAEDLVLRPAFQDACRRACEDLARDTADGGPAVLVGLPWNEDGKVYNAYAALDAGAVAAVRFKVDLPNYGVFDEKRVFAAGPLPGPVSLRGLRLGLPICEDIWGEEVVECLAETGSEILLVPNGSPYWHDKMLERYNIAAARVTETGLPMAYLNQVGGQDELVFDGASFILNGDASLAGQFRAFAETVALTEWRREPRGWRCVAAPRELVEEGEQADYAACVLGLRDYVEKSGFPGVVLGLSGGIDSALCAAMAVDALGSERVHCIMLPYRYTSSESLNDAAACAKALNVRYDILPIASAVEGLEAALAPLFAGTPRGVTEENLQSRARGTMLMSVSNKFGAMVVTTGNKSEMSTGYATLYGDMNGGFNPIKDLYKTEVYRLSALRNGWKPSGALGPDGEVVPANILVKAPTAELREGQKDQDSLPPYDILDDILVGLVEEERRVAEIVARGHDEATVKKVERLLYLAEYKRRQSAPGVKVTRRNFGRDRRYPIVNHFRDTGAPAHVPEAGMDRARGAARADAVDF